MQNAEKKQLMNVKPSQDVTAPNQKRKKKKIIVPLTK